MACLAAVARALDRGDIVLAQIATLQLQIPDPPTLTKLASSTDDIMDLIRRLQRSGMLKADWDPTKHPRWPGGSPDSKGGQFAPVGSATSSGSPAVTPAQFTLPAPLEMPFRLPLPIPRPFEIVPPPITIPDTFERDIPTNPYPRRRKCVKEWEEAKKYCRDLQDRGLLGKGDYRGMTKKYWKCVLGLISEDCGGNATGA
jgi:hypothetical protein